MAADAQPSSRFTSQGSTAQDLLASQTVGLVHLSDFRKRRADALDQKEREAGNFGRFASGHSIGSKSGDVINRGDDEGYVGEFLDRRMREIRLIVKGQCCTASRTTQEEAKTDHKGKAIIRDR